MATPIKFASYTIGSAFVFSSGKRIEFADGYYKTSDSQEIAELRAAANAHGMICEGDLAYAAPDIAAVEQPALPTPGTAAAIAAAKAATAS